MFNFNPLWKQIIDKNMTKTELRKKANFSMRTLATMGKNEYVAMSILDKICKTLNCKIEDVIEFINEESEENK